MVEFKQLNRKMAVLLTKAMGFRKCRECEKKITMKNWGAVHKLGAWCNDIICLTAMIDEIEQDEKGHKNN